MAEQWYKADKILPKMENTFTSETVDVKIDTGHIKQGYYDFGRGRWYITGALQNETPVLWRYIRL